MVDMFPSHAGIISPTERWRNKLLKMDMLFQEVDKLWLMLFHRLGHVVVDIPKGCLHG